MKAIFRTVGYLEAISTIVLFGVAMPMKYIYGMPEATRTPGLVHGILFLAYIALAHALSEIESWNGRKLKLAYLASVVPLGTLVFDWKFLHGSGNAAAAQRNE